MKIRFEIKGNTLYVANAGVPFGRSGVISVCRQNLSAKSSVASGMETYECNDADLISVIRQLRVDIYRQDPNQLLEDSNSEDETRQDYSDRSLLELLQNADDAMAPAGAAPGELIGAKGLGFKAVLEISDRPEVHSGPFNFGFDAARSREELKNVRGGQKVGIFRRPHEVEPDASVRRLLRAGFVTVIKLPFKDDAAQRRTVSRLQSLSPHFLLLSQHLECVEIRGEEIGLRDLTRSGPRGSPSGTRCSLRVKDGGTTASTMWRVWMDVWPAPAPGNKRLSVAIAVEIVNGVPTPSADALPLYVFYPTDDSLNAGFLVHGSFSVQQNRKHIRRGDQDELLLDRLDALVRRITLSLPAASTINLASGLASTAPKNKPRGLIKLIHYRLTAAVLSTPFVPVLGAHRPRVQPKDVRTYVEGFGAVLNTADANVSDAQLSCSELEIVFSNLGSLGAKPLQSPEYARLFASVHCETVSDCIAAARLVLRTCLSNAYLSPQSLMSLWDAPFWPTSDGRIRALSDAPPLVIKKRKDWPSWAEADELDEEFRAAIFSEHSIPKDWGRLVVAHLHSSEAAYLIHCVVPSIESWTDADWQAWGWELLRLVETWLNIPEWRKIRPFVPEGDHDDTREALVSVARVYVAKKWVPARETYARSELNAPTGLARFFQDIPGRHLCGYPAEARKHFSRERWRALLRYLGVSWEPKVRSFEEEVDQTAAPAETAFWAELYPSGMRIREKDWYLEYFPGCLASDVPASSLALMVEGIVSAVDGLAATYFKVYGTTRTHPAGPFKTFIDYQLRREAFLPTRGGVLLAPGIARASQLYWPKSGLRGMTPFLDLSGVKEARRSVLKPMFARSLGVQTELPTDWERWLEWCDSLADSAQKKSLRGGIRVARDFYEAFLEHKFSSLQPAKPTSVVCVSNKEAEGYQAISPDNVAWIDRASLAPAEVLEALLEAGLEYLPCLLERGEGSTERLGVQPASELVTIDPRFSVQSPADTARLERRLSARWRALAAICESKRIRPPRPITPIGVHGLEIGIALGSEQVAHRAAAAVRSGDVWLINLDGDRWDALALAAADGLGHAVDLRYRFGAVLKARNSEEVIRILNDDGIPSYRLRNVTLEEEEEEEEALDDEPFASATSAADEEMTGPAESETEEDEDIFDPGASDGTGAGNEEAGSGGGTGRIAKRNLYDNRSFGGHDPTSSAKKRKAAADAARRAAAKGLAGEEWLAERIRVTAPPGWTAARNIMDDQLGESDILLKNGALEWHIEVKTLATERIYWSDLERAKAARNPGRYCMCFLVHFQDGYIARWSWDPLVSLLSCERRVQWTWSLEGEGPPLPPGSWMATAGLRPPEVQPNRSGVVIRVQEEHLDSLDRDDDTLEVLWSRILNSRA